MLNTFPFCTSLCCHLQFCMCSIFWHRAICVVLSPEYKMVDNTCVLSVVYYLYFIRRYPNIAKPSSWWPWRDSGRKVSMQWNFQQESKRNSLKQKTKWVIIGEHMFSNQEVIRKWSETQLEANREVFYHLFYMSTSCRIILEAQKFIWIIWIWQKVGVVKYLLQYTGNPAEDQATAILDNHWRHHWKSREVN